MKNVCEFAKTIFECGKSETEAIGLCNLDSQGLDNLKDWTEAFKNLSTGLKDYLIAEAMMEEAENDRMCYKRKPMRSYIPMEYRHDMNDDYDYDNMGRSMRMGYRENMSNNRYGQSYNNYRMAKRHYSSNPTTEEKHKMKEHIHDTLNDIDGMITEMWHDVDEADKAKYRDKFQSIMNRMN